MMPRAHAPASHDGVIGGRWPRYAMLDSGVPSLSEVWQRKTHFASSRRVASSSRASVLPFFPDKSSSKHHHQNMNSDNHHVSFRGDVVFGDTKMDGLSATTLDSTRSGASDDASSMSLLY